MSKDAAAKPGLEIKVYCVIERSNVARPGQPNRKIVAAKLTRKAAEEYVAEHPGTYVEKHVATK